MNPYRGVGANPLGKPPRVKPRVSARGTPSDSNVPRAQSSQGSDEMTDPKLPKAWDCVIPTHSHPGHRPSPADGQEVVGTDRKRDDAGLQQARTTE